MRESLQVDPGIRLNGTFDAQAKILEVCKSAEKTFKLYQKKLS